MNPELSFHAVHEPQLPPMAWLAAIEGPDVRVHHGSRVEVWDQGFFEGAYAGRWLDDDPSQCADVFGSGMVIRDSEFHIVTPSHTLEAVFVCQRDGVIFASNSLAFLIERTDLRVPIRYSYSARLVSGILGYQRCEHVLIESKDGNVERFMMQNVAVRPSGEMQIVPKPTGDAFSDFDTYIKRITEAVRAVALNASDSRRGNGYQLTCTISSGYDSTMAAVIGIQAGLRHSISLTEARVGGADSGREIGDELGLQIAEYARPGVMEPSFDDLAPFMVSGMGGEDYYFLSFQRAISERVVLTGFLADAWDSKYRPNSELARRDCSGMNLQEFRIQNDFVHLPVPLIASGRHGSIYSLTNSEEMHLYRSWDNYDKPIPRKVLLSAGIQGRLLATVSKGASYIFFYRDGFRAHMRWHHLIVSRQVRTEVLRRAERLGMRPAAINYRVAALVWVAKRHVFRRLMPQLENVNARFPATLVNGDFSARLARTLDRIAARMDDTVRQHEIQMPMMSVMFLVSLELVRERYRLPSSLSEAGA